MRSLDPLFLVTLEQPQAAAPDDERGCASGRIGERSRTRANEIRLREPQQRTQNVEIPTARSRERESPNILWSIDDRKRKRKRDAAYA